MQMGVKFLLIIWPKSQKSVINLMGNYEGKTSLDRQEVYLGQVQSLSQTDLLFQSKLSNSGQDARLSRKIYSFNSSSQNITSYLEKLNFFGQHIECENLLLPVYCYIHEQKGMCSEEKQLQIYHEIYSINIRDEIIARKKHYEKFSENQVWYLLYSIVNACRKFEVFKIKSGNLKTSNIVLNNRGHVKIKNLLTQPETKAYALPNYFSPQQLLNMRENRNQKLHQNICQTFSIALIILQICTFIDAESFYDMSRFKINDQIISRALEAVQKQKYSKLLQNLLRIMLTGHSDRPLPSQIYLTFKPYEQQIVNLQGFKFDTSKIYESLQTSQVSLAYRS